MPSNGVKTKTMKMVFRPLTTENWQDFETLFGQRGACGGCWCMFWKKPRKQYHADVYEKNRLDQKRIVEKGVIPGILAYLDGQPVGWCAFEPRENYPALSRSRILKPIDDKPVWSVTCFFVDKNFRKQGVTVALLKEVLKYVSSKGGRIVEGYPVEVVGDKAPDPFIFTGTASAYKRAGFVEVARRSATRPIFRYKIK
jgi:GNAT superfamily N-acetyltransferase